MLSEAGKASARRWEDRMARLRFLTASLALLLGTLALPSHATTLEKPSIQLAVGGKTLVAYLPLTIAERRGYFTKEGLKVEIFDFQGGSKALEALVGGSADVVCGAYEHTLYMAAKGLSIKAIALQANSFGLVVGVQKNKAPSYQSLRDLKGMKIGVTGPGSASAMGLRMLLAKASLTADDVSIIGVGGGAAAVAAVTTGKLDAIANFDPAMSLLERDGAIRTILDTRKQKDLEYLYGGPFAASAFYTDARFIQRYPNTTQAFVNAISAAIDWLNKASTDEIVAAVPPEYFAGDRALYRAMIESNRERVSPDGKIPPQAAEITYRNLSSFEETMKNTKVDVVSTYDNSFIEKAPTLRAK
jgi:NitT/TauT family transport system substrate-binding protein